MEKRQKFDTHVSKILSHFDFTNFRTSHPEMAISDSGDSETPIILPSEQAQKRTCTNTSFFIAFATCCVIVIPFSIAWSMGSDIHRFFHGYDRYGNTCGVKNKPIDGINCSGQDMSDRPISTLRYYPVNKCLRYSRMKILPDFCDDKCDPPNRLIFHRCFPAENVRLEQNSKYYKEILEILHGISGSVWTIVLESLLGLVVALGVLVVLRWYYTNRVFYTMVGFQIIVSVILISVSWHKYLCSEEKERNIYLLLALGTKIYIICIITFIIFFHKNFSVILRLYDEAITTIFALPSLFFHSILSLLAQTLILAFMLFITILIFTNQCLYQTDLFTFEYRTKSSSFVLALFVFFVTLWIFAFAEGWQALVVAGGVSRYHFERDKSLLEKPTRKSLHLMVRYHLGSVAYGSLIVLLLSFITNFANYIVRKIYVQIAIRGFSICESAKRVFRLLDFNRYNTLAITGFHCIFTCGFICLVFISTISLGVSMNQTLYSPSSLGILLGAAAAFAISNFIFQVLSVAVDTTFLCFCEEEENKERDSRCLNGQKLSGDYENEKN